MRICEQEQQPVSGDVGGSVFTEGRRQPERPIISGVVGQGSEQLAVPEQKGKTRVSSLADLLQGVLANFSIGPDRV